MSREFYQDGWGRRKNKYKQDNYPCQNQVDVEVDEDYSQHDYSYDHDMKKTIDQKAPSIVEGRRQQSKCCPFDAYGINTNCNTSYTFTNVVKDDIEDISIPLNISVTIPAGYILPEGRNYEWNLSINKSALSVNTMTQYYVCADMGYHDCGCPEVSKMQVAVLNGPLYYNLTVKNFTPAQPLQTMLPIQSSLNCDYSCESNCDDRDKCIQIIPAYFNEKGSLVIDKIISYIPMGGESLTGYTIDVTCERQSIMLQDGRCLSRYANLEEYQCVLVNPDIEKVLNFAYKVTIKSTCYDREKN